MHRAAFFLSLVLPSILFIALPCSAAVSHGFRVPDGFEVSLYAGDDLAHDIFSMTTDAKGRIVVAGKDYVKILHDTDGDGKADKATLFVKASKTGAHGMYFDGPDLIMNGDGGIRRWRDTDGDGVADGEPEFWLRTERDGEHSANGIVKGPDGWFYLRQRCRHLQRAREAPRLAHQTGQRWRARPHFTRRQDQRGPRARFPQSLRH